MADEFSADDTLLQHYLDTAEAFVIGYTHRTGAELNEMGGGAFPLPVTQAILLVGGDWYNQREDSSAVAMRPIPNGFRALVMPYRKLSNTTDTTSDE